MAEESNKDILQKLDHLLKKIILPQVDDQTLVTFGCTCKLASRLVHDFIISRGIVLREDVEEQESPKITLLDYTECDNFDLTMKGSLESGLLCAKRYTNFKNTGMDVSFTHSTMIESKTLKTIVEFCEVASSKDDDEIEKWVIMNLADARVERLIDIIQGAEELKIESLLRKSINPMAGHINGKTTKEIIKIFDLFAGSDYEGDYDLDNHHETRNIELLERMRHFLELMIPSLDDVTYLRFASVTNCCAKLLNDFQSRKCFFPGDRGDDPWKISLFCCDGQTLEATKDLMCFSGLIKNFQIDHPCGLTMKITLKSTTSQLLRHIITFCSKHGSTDLSNASLKKFDSEFVQRFKLLDLAKAAETLKIHCLLDLVVPRIVSMIHHKEAREIRATFGIENDFDMSESRWWGDYEYIVTRRTKIRRSMKQIIQPWEDVKAKEPPPSIRYPVKIPDISDESSESDDSEEVNEEEYVDYEVAFSD